MPRDEVWGNAIQENSLKAGWHLTRNDARSDFLPDFLSLEAFALDLSRQTVELARLLKTDTFTPTHSIPVAFPKGRLGTRPGSYLALPDRVVLWSVVAQMAPVFDKYLDAGVYSYRLKENPKKGELFAESDVLDIPFLKKKYISRKIDPFEPWYGQWPEFEKASRDATLAGYRFMSVTDIAGYFENISHILLADAIAMALPEEPKLTNFIQEILRCWTVQSDHGFRPQRGIPQGSGISSFLGNIFLIPLDRFFRNFAITNDIVYCRYMDDIRIFSKTITTARRVIFELEKQIRRLHLNVQTAKTKILDERKGEVSNFLFDDRIERIKTIRDNATKQKPTLTRKKAIIELKTLARQQPTNPTSQPFISRKQEEKSDLTLRAMRMWMNTNILLGDDDHARSLYSLIVLNSDPRLMKIFINNTRAFHHQLRWQRPILNFLRSEFNIFPYQEAQFICGLRYLSRLDTEIIARIKQNISNDSTDVYLRLESLICGARILFTKAELDEIWRRFRSEQSWLLMPYYTLVLSQKAGPSQDQLLQTLSRHPHPGGGNGGPIFCRTPLNRRTRTRIPKFCLRTRALATSQRLVRSSLADRRVKKSSDSW